MRIKILRTFTDLQASDPADAEVPAGKKITVTADRGAKLVGLGLAEEVDAKPAQKKPRKPAAPSAAAVAADASPPAVPPAPDTGTASVPTT